MSDSIEPYLAWQQLTLARYIDGTFSGVASGGGAVPGINVPKSRVQGAGWSFGFKNGVANANEYAQDLSNYMAFGTAIAGGLTRGAALIPNDAWQVDVKSDNGLPITGRIVALKRAALPNCTLNDSTLDAGDAAEADDTYNLTYATAACGLNMSLTLK